MSEVELNGEFRCTPEHPCRGCSERGAGPAHESEANAARDDLSVLDALASDEVGEIIGERLLQRALLRLREAVASRSEVTLSPEEAHHLLRRIGGDDGSE